MKWGELARAVQVRLIGHNKYMSIGGPGRMTPRALNPAYLGRSRYRDAAAAGAAAVVEDSSCDRGVRGRGVAVTGKQLYNVRLAKLLTLDLH